MLNFVIKFLETVTVEEIIDEILSDKTTAPNQSKENGHIIETSPQRSSLPAEEEEPCKSLSLSLSLSNNYELLTFLEKGFILNSNRFR